MSQLSLTPARKAMVLAGGLLVAATWIYLVLVRPTSWESVAGSTEALITLGGYVGGAVFCWQAHCLFFQPVLSRSFQ